MSDVYANWLLFIVKPVYDIAYSTSQLKRFANIAIGSFSRD